MDHGLAREREAWEATDGAVCLLKEISALAPEIALSVLPILATVADKVDYSHAQRLQERIWRQVPLIAEGVVSGFPRGVGKRKFKVHLELLLPSLFNTLTSGVPLSKVAAADCIVSLSKLLGEGIFIGRLKPEMAEALLRSPDVQDEKLKAQAAGRLGGGPIAPIAPTIGTLGRTRGGRPAVGAE